MKYILPLVAVICVLTSCTKEALVPDIAPRVSSTLLPVESILDLGAEYHVVYDYKFHNENSQVIRTGTCLFLDNQTMNVVNDETEVTFQQDYMFSNDTMRVYFDGLAWMPFAYNLDSLGVVTQFPQYGTSLTIYFN